MSSLHAVVMAGGSGTRFWPASRAARPKQFLPLVGGKPLIEATIDRLQGLVDPEHIWIATNRKQAKTLTKLLPHIGRERLILEPEPRDTAPCVALATATIAALDPAATMIVLPADHVIEPIGAFQDMLRAGVELASDGKTLVTFGITPTFAATGYGYIECGPALPGKTLRDLRGGRFREKPDRATAEQFLQQGNFLWNSGIFVWTVAGDPRRHGAATSRAGRQHRRRCSMALQKQEKAATTRAFLQAPKTLDRLRGDGEGAKVGGRRGARRSWDDVGSFPALGAVGASDDDGNFSVLAGGASQLALQSRDNIVYAEGERTVALFGVHDLSSSPSATR
jgi:mannose-1-phosphate guanylyltransferase